MQDGVDVVGDDPGRLALAGDGARQETVVALHREVHLVADRLHLARVAAGGDDEEIGVVAHRPHVEDGDVGRQLLLAEGGDAASLLERCQVGQLPRSGGGSVMHPFKVGQKCSGGSRPDQAPRYRPRRSISAATAGGTRSSIGSPAATRSRTSDDETASGVIGNSSIRSGRDSEATTRSRSAQIGARPRRRADARQLENAIRAHPGRKGGELVGAEQEEGIVEPERLERVDRAGERIERDLGLVDRRERELGERSLTSRRRVDVLVAGVGHDTDEQPIEPEVIDRLPRERDVPVVRWVERAAEDPDAPLTPRS